MKRSALPLSEPVRAGAEVTEAELAAMRRRRAIKQARLALAPIAADPLPSTAHADPRGLGRRGQRPSLNQHPLTQQPAATQLSAALA
jgi:hypothetical protein